MMQLTFTLMFPVPGYPDGFIQNRCLYLQARVNPRTGWVSFAVEEPDERDPAITQAERAV